MTQSHRVVIVGASIAGLTVAESLRHEGFDGEIVLMGDEPHLPYNRPPLSKQLLSGEWESDRAIIKSNEDLTNLGIQFHSSTRALQLDLNKRLVMTSAGIESFDDLVIATGARARELGSKGIQTLRTLDDAISLRNQIQRAKRVIVIGTGVLGSEIASGVRALGSEVVMIGELPEMSFGSVGNALSKQITALHEENGVELRLQTDVLDTSISDDGATIRTSKDEVVHADVVVAAIGAVACTDWLVGSGLEIADGVLCNERGLAAPGVYAVGDVAAWSNPKTSTARRIEHQTNAIEQAMAVAGTIARDSEAKPLVPFFWSDIHKVSIKAYGWFDGKPLTELPTASPKGSLLVAESDGETRGIISWNAPPQEFRKARSLVEQSNNISLSTRK